MCEHILKKEEQIYIHNRKTKHWMQLKKYLEIQDINYINGNNTNFGSMDNIFPCSNCNENEEFEQYNNVRMN